MPLFLLLACREPVPDGGFSPASLPSPLPQASPSPVLSLRERFEREGFWVQRGAWSWLDWRDCCGREGLCLLNNPSSPYGYLTVPPGPGQIAADRDGGRWFHLRRDEALLILAQAPPAARYFSFRSYLAVRPSNPPSQQLVLASLGPSLNHLLMAEQRGRPIWGEPMALLVTADAGVEARVAEIFEQAGHDPATLHFDRIPETLVRPGLDAQADLFSATARVALFEDPEAGEAWMADPGATVWRLTPKTPVQPAQPHPVPALPAPGRGTDESAWQEALSELEQAILQRWSAYASLPGVSSGQGGPPLDCLEDFTCGGDSSDRYYGVLPSEILLPPGDRFVVVYGVNHQRTGKASYASFSVDTRYHLLGIDGIDSEQMVGTASFYLPDHPQADDLYAVSVARSCAGRAEACLEVPVDCPGTPLTEPITLSFRAYLEPATGAAPLESEMLPDRAIAFWSSP